MSLYKTLAENDTEKKLLHSKFGRALEEKNYMLAEELLNKGVEIDYNGEYFLCSACEKGDLEVVNFLLDNGADVKHEFSLYMAFVNGHKAVINLFFERGANLEDAPIKEMAMWCNFEYVEYLLEKGIKLENNEDAIKGMILSGNVDMFELYQNNGVTIEMIENYLEKNAYDLKLDDYNNALPTIRKWCEINKLAAKIEKELESSNISAKASKKTQKNKI